MTSDKDSDGSDENGIGDNQKWLTLQDSFSSSFSGVGKSKRGNSKNKQWKGDIKKSESENGRRKGWVIKQ